MPAFHVATVASKTMLENSSSLISTTAQSLSLSLFCLLFTAPNQLEQSVSSHCGVYGCENKIYSPSTLRGL